MKGEGLGMIPLWGLPSWGSPSGRWLASGRWQYLESDFSFGVVFTEPIASFLDGLVEWGELLGFNFLI